MKEEIVLYGAGKIGERCIRQYKANVVAVIDCNKYGQTINNIPIISLNEYIEKYRDKQIWISTRDFQEIEMLLKSYDIHNYKICNEVWEDELVVHEKEISHENWIQYLKEQFDKPGVEILEVGSRVVTGANWRNLFEYANYTGFDYYAGENVDVVGDAHKLSQYFDKKFDLIFSSAVFEHLAMPWKVSLEIIKLLKLGGCVFVETHYSYSSHERPWHFFQYSENALNVLFPEAFGMKCVKKGCSNLIVNAEFADNASEYLRGKAIGGLYAHSEFLAKKMREEVDLDWNKVELEEVVGSTKYPPKKI